jgi:WD40 repeat protein
VAIAAGIAALVVVLAVVTGLWRKSVRETRRAESVKLLTLGKQALATERTSALAYAITSLELADIPETRRLALEALWAGPPATVVPWKGFGRIAFSPDGRYLVRAISGVLQVFPRDGGPAVTLLEFEGRGLFRFSFSADSRLLIASANRSMGEVRVWETDSWRETRVLQVPGVLTAYGFIEPGTNSVLTVGFRSDDPKATNVSGSTPGTWSLHRWPLENGPPQLVGSAPGTLAPAAGPDFERDLIVVGQGSEVHLHRLSTFGREPPRVIARSPDGHVMSQAVFDPSAERVALIDAALNLDLWPLEGDGHQPEVELDSKVTWAAFSPDGSHVATASDSRGADGRLWDLRGPAVAAPLGFDNGMLEMQSVAFSPDSRWLATAGSGFKMALWPLTDRYPRILFTRDPEARSEAFAVGGSRRPTSIAYAPDGSRLYVVTAMDGVKVWPLSGGAGQEPWYLFRGDVASGWTAVDPGGRFLLIGTLGGAFKVPLDGSPPDLIDDAPTRFIALSSDGRRAAVRTGDPGILAVVDLKTGRRWEVEAPGEGKPDQWGYAFDPEGRLLVARGGVLSRCDYVSGSAEVLLDEGVGMVHRPQGSQRLLLQMFDGRLSMLDLDDGSLAQLCSRDGQIAFDIDPSFEVMVIGHQDGSISVGLTSGGEAHLLLGHEGPIVDVRLSTDRQWIASLGDDDTIRLWPMPDLTKPPLHTLPRAQLIAKLKSLTNLRAVPDEESYTGYKLEPDFTAYRGWETVPSW